MLTYTGVHLDNIARDGYAVLLLHAFPLSSAMWVEQLGALFRYHVPTLAPNVYGVEGSDPHHPWTFREYIGEVVALLEELGIGKVTVAGLSMGGYQAFELYRQAPDKIRSMVLCDTRSEADTPEALENRWAFIEAVTANGPEEAVEAMLPKVFALPPEESSPVMVETFSSIVMHQSGEAIAAAMRAIAERPDSTGMLADISCPVTLITGKEDRLTPPELARSMQRKIAGSELHLIDNAGHLSNMEQPRAFNELLLGHLEATGSLPEA
ncbi:alpha/beta fold hydrolase [Prosthecochloris sp. ZM_2]|uniref:alpha/beta fold hydrolase n=1 Tax=Prosthecochloris sp. ZM_2 TaxID=2045206 RepID=UPI000DF85394|nr:alpha/beta fold hydrolase [Prosthecochloris sp. ZM_2]RNA65458.1 alpha/beta fold hydrolase [Prosthecochloris sp. ZM_2]